MRFLLDTNVVCEITAKNPEPRVLKWIDAHSHESLLSIVTIGEIWKGIHRLPEGKRKRGLMRWVENLEQEFSEQCLTLDTQTLKAWGKLYAANEARGFQLDVIDSLIAAQALQQNLIVVTRNITDYPAETTTLNPWIP